MTAMTTERSNRAIDITADYLVQKDGYVTAQSIYDQLNRTLEMLQSDDAPPYPILTVDDVLGAIEDILQHSYHVI